MKAQKKMTGLAPEIARLKEKYAGDKEKFARAQMELYRQAGANPAAGCLPLIIQFVILIALYQVFIQLLQANGGVVAKINEMVYPFLRLPQDATVNLSFLYLDLARPDVFKVNNIPLPGFFLLLAAATQFLSTKMMAPVVNKAQKVAAKTPQKTDDMATMMQSQMLYLFPLMTIFIGYTFPSGLVLYWFVFSAFQLVQQYLFSGWGGLQPWVAKLPFSGKMG